MSVHWLSNGCCSFHSEREQGYRSSGLSGDEDGIDGKKKKKKKGLLFHLNIRLIFYMYIVMTMAELTSSLIKLNNNRYVYSQVINTFMKDKSTLLMILSNNKHFLQFFICLRKLYNLITMIIHGITLK